MREITKEEIERTLDEHEIWIKSNGTEGTKAFFYQRDFTKINKLERSYQKVHFEECVFDKRFFLYANLGVDPICWTGRRLI